MDVITVVIHSKAHVPPTMPITSPWVLRIGEPELP